MRRIPVAAHSVGEDGLIGDADIRAQVVAVLATLVRHVEIHHQMR